METNVIVSIIVPIYNVEQYLPQCIESIINQTYQNIEIILVDDGSPDNCGIICDDYAKKDKRIIVYHIKHTGLSGARNYGIERANGEYLGFVDSDDWIEPDMYEVLLNTAKDYRADIVNCGFYRELTDQAIVDYGVFKKYDNSITSAKAVVHDEISIVVWNKLFHKSCFSGINFPNGHVFEEIFTVYKLFLQSVITISISKPLYHYRAQRQGAITQTRSMDNLIDYWRAHISRYNFFLADNRFNTDLELIGKLYHYCAIAIARTWGWYYICTDEEKEKYASELKEIHDFCVQHFPLFSMKYLTFREWLPVSFGRFNNKFIFELLYYTLQGYRWARDILVRFRR